MQLGAITVNEPIRSISAVKKYARAKPKRGGETMQYKRIQSMSAAVLDANRIARDINSGIGRLFIHRHITPLQAEAARRYAYVMARYEKYYVEGRRSARSPSFERAYGQDQELERLHANDPVHGIADYEDAALKALREYNKLQKVLAGFPGAKNVLDDLCCSDIEPASQYRENMATVLSAVAKKFGVTETRRVHRKKGKR